MRSGLFAVCISCVLLFFFVSCDDDDSNNGNNINNINNSNNINNVNNTNNVNSTIDVWSPAPQTTWQWQLSNYPVNTAMDVEMYDIDLFDVAQATIDTLHEDGIVVICYFSAGSYEDWRADAGDFDAADYGNPLDGWDGEYWVDTRSENVRNIIRARLDYAVERGCDGVEPDNVDGFQNDPGFPLTYQTQLDFNLFLSQEAHARGLSVGLKNDGDQIPDLIAYFDWSLNEECVAYDECSLYRDFIDDGKPVFHVEYIDAYSQATQAVNTVCYDAQRDGFSTLIKVWDLDAWYYSCAEMGL